MANVKLSFYGTKESETDEHYLECFANTRDEIYLSIDTQASYPSFICLDVPTAIKLSKVLSQSIREIKEANNG